MNPYCHTAYCIDILTDSIAPRKITIEDGIITNIESANDSECNSFILPGFIDAHVHIESSLLIPSEFARMAVVHGMVGTISDPHEIANVLGVFGVEYISPNIRTPHNNPSWSSSRVILLASIPKFQS